jgi:hypothetical protein
MHELFGKSIRHSQMFNIPLFVLLLIGVSHFDSIVQVSAIDCTAVPISFSDISLCEDDHCFVSQQVFFSIPIFRDSSACLEFVPPDGISASTSVNITVHHPYYEWSSDSVYYTDDSEFGQVSDTGDGIGGAGTCPSCTTAVPPGSPILCVSDTYIADGNEIGYFCAKIGLAGGDRYKIIELDEPEIVIDVLVDYNSALYGIVYNGETIELSEDTDNTTDLPFNLTLLSDSAEFPQGFDFVVYDYADACDFYILGNQYVNSITDYDSNKLGWYKPSESKVVSNSITSQITIHLNKQDDTVTTDFGWTEATTLLTDLSSKLSDIVSPGSLLYDSDIGDPDGGCPGQVAPNHRIDPLPNLYDGVNCVGLSDDFDSIGTSAPPPLYNIFGIADSPWGGAIHLTALFNNGTTVFINNTIVVADYYPVKQFCLDANYEIPDYVLQLFVAPDNNYFFCKCATSLLSCDCRNFTFTALRTPDYTPVMCTWGRGNTTGATVRMVCRPYAPATKTPAKLVAPITEGVMNFVLELRNFSVTFDSATVKVVIRSAKQDGENLIVVANSFTVGGTCFAYSSPPEILISQPIDLAVSPTTYNLTIDVSEASGNFTFGIRCFKQGATIVVPISIDQAINSTTDETTTTNNTDAEVTDAFNPFNWGEILDHFTGDPFGWLNDPTQGWNWRHLVIMIVEILGGILIAILAIVILVKTIPCLFRAFKSSKSSMSRFMPFMKSPTEKMKYL